MTGPTGAGRTAWLDLARAISIVLVVLYHVGVTAGPELLGGVDSRAYPWWAAGNLALIPLRMPLFFLIAGALAAGAIRRPWARVIRPRILDLLWPYLLWCLLFAVTGWPRYAPDDPLGFLVDEITGMLVIGSPYWFIAVLPIFFVLTRLGRDHRALLVAGALAAYAAAPIIQQQLLAADTDADLVYGVFQVTDNLLWFVLGYVLRDVILAAGARARVLTGLTIGAPLLLAFCALALVVLQAERSVMTLRALEFAASLAGLAACIALIPLLARWAPLARAGAHIGSRTLVIYLLHPIVLNLVVIAWVRTGAAAQTASLVRDLLLVPALTAAAIGVALAADAAVARWGPRWLLKAPRREKDNSPRPAPR